MIKGFIESFKENIDKFMHMGICMLASILSPIFAIGLAIGKEYGDSRAKDNHWCWLDILADYVGVVFGTAIHFAIFGIPEPLFNL